MSREFEIITIDAKTFGHIELDAELNAVFGVQGNTFKVTMGYLNQYIKQNTAELQTQLSAESLKQLNQITQRMVGLIEQEEAILSTGNTKNKLTGTSKRIVDQILGSTLKAPVTIPGGWNNAQGEGHAMIYEFEKTDDDKLIFSIYNSGAGIEHHEKQSSEATENFFPIKSFIMKLPKTEEEKQNLENLVFNLALAQLPYNEARPKNKQMNAKELYETIEKNLAYLDSTPVLASETKKNITTAGQLSGTCSQRSLHQMLKVNFESLPHYQRFIFEFKMHALREYIQSPKRGKSKKVQDDIILAIQNNLKIMQEPGLFDSPKQKNRAAHELMDLKTQVEHELMELKTQVENEVAVELPERQRIDVNEEKNGSLAIPLYSGNRFDQKMDLSDVPKTYEPIRPLSIKPPKLIEKLTQFVDSIPLKTLKDDPVKTLMDIEQVIRQLPLPQDGAQFDTTLEFYKEIKAHKQFDALCNIIQTLQFRHAMALRKCTEKSEFPPTAAITQLNLLAIYDYVDNQDAKIHKRKSLHPYMIQELQNRLNHYSPVLFSTRHVEADQQYKHIRALYLSMAKQSSFDLLTYYQELISSNQEISEALLNLYDASDKDPFIDHDYLKNNNLAQLHYLLTQFDKFGVLNKDSPLEEPRYSSLISQINLSIDYEQFIGESYDISPNGDNVYFLKLTLEKEYHGTKATFTSPSKKFDYAVKNEAKLSHAKRDADLTASLLLQKTNYSLNEIQLYTNDPTLEFLRYEPQYQLNLTLDHFNQSIHTLKDQTNKVYFESNLFDPGLLKEALNNDPSFLKRMDDFLDKGLLYFTNPDGSSSDESLYFIRLSLNFNQYVAECLPVEAKKRLLKEIEGINKQLSTEKDPAKQATLHQYRLLAVMAYHQHAPENHQFLSDAVRSFFQTALHDSRNILEDPAFKFDLITAKRQLNDWAQTATPAQQKEMAEEMIRALLPIVPETIQLEGTYPLFTFQKAENHYQINLQEGVIYNNAKALMKIPPSLKNNPLLKRLGLEHETTCYCSSNNTLFEFKTSDANVRIKLDNKYTPPLFAVQKEWVHDGESTWYELRALTSKQCTDTQMDAYLNASGLPLSLTDDSTQAWENIDGSEGFITQNNKKIYCFNKFFIFTVDETGKDTGSILVSGSDCPALLALESSDFLRVNRVDQNTADIHFDRYDIELKQENGQMFIPQTTYTLLPPEKSPLSQNIAHLAFKNNESHQQCIVAVQRFYVDPNTPQVEGTYYKLTHDTNNKIAGEILKQHHKQDKPWQYQQSEKSITYPIVDGKLKPNTPADALYLCYLYLAEHDYDKAWALLEDIGKYQPLEGNEDELTYLSWIINALPMMLEGTDDKAISSASRDVACKLKALSLYTDFLSQGKSPNLSKPAALDAQSLANATIKNQRLDDAQAFHDDLNKTIYTLYTQFIQRKDHLSDQFKLSDGACKSLLTQTRISNETQGALGFEWRRLSLESLIREQEKLNALIEKNPGIPPAIKKRRDAIQAQLSEQTDIMKRSTVLELAPIDTTLGYQYLRALHSINLTNAEDNAEDKKAIDLLHSEINDDDFIHYFYRYLNIAKNPNTDDPLKSKLNIFCKRCLIGSRFKSLAQHDSPVPYLSNIIYRVINNPTCLDTLETISFYDLCDRVRDLTVPPIEIYQTKDVFLEPLKKTQTLIEDIRQTITPSRPITTVLATDRTPPKLIQTILDTAPFLKKASDGYTAAEAAYQTELNKCRESTSPDKEMRAGQIKLKCMQAQQKIANEYLTYSHREKLKEAAKTHLESLKGLHPSIEDVLKEANRELTEHHAIELASGQRHLLTEQELNQCYLHADVSLYQQLTCLDEESCRALHASLHAYMTLAVETQQTTRLIHTLENAHPNDVQLAQIAQLVMSQNLPEAQDDPALMLFQHEENILLRPRQVEALKNLLSTPDDPMKFNDSVEKVIMGGGKSKVILPLLAQQKATGFNLVIVEVPQALLATNHIDLNNTSQRLFGQRAYRFEFNRDSDCSPGRLKQIHDQFTDMMNNKSYLVTTGESMQSLELKYIELLLVEPKNQDEKWKAQISWLGQITELLKQRGDAIIDEVHQGLLLKRKLNYTMGQPEAIHHELIQHTLALYQFIHAKFIRLDRESLTSSLLNDPESPLHDILSLCKAEELRDYLENKKEPAFLSSATTDVKNKLAFYKEQIKLLPFTQSRQYQENYGPSKLLDKSNKERALAIPYSANDKPNEQSRFGNALETLNYTTQAMLIEGVSIELLKETIQRWKDQAQIELQDNLAYGSINKTPTAEQAHVYLGRALDTVDLKNTNLIKELHDKVKNNHSLIYHVLEQSILPQITVERSILHSDAYNHVDLYRSTQGLSGTPSNYSTFHQRMQFNQSTSLGTDGYIQAILKEKKTPILPCTFDKTKETLENYLNKLKKSATSTTIHAIIDVNATLVGLSNLEVAQALSKTFCQDRKPPLQYVLYFNENDTLCAWDIAKSNSISLSTSDPDVINKKLKCKPEDRFTYYDQAHTTGTDIKQPSAGSALCLVDEKTTLQNFLQGALRMRGLDESQSIKIIVPETMRAETLKSLTQRMHECEIKQLKEDNFYAAIAKLNNVVRLAALNAIEYASTPEEKSELTRQLKAYFVETQAAELFEQFGAIYQIQETETVLNQHLSTLLEECKQHALDASDLQKKMQSVIKEALPHCNNTCLSAVNNKTNSEVQVQKEQLKEMEQKKENEQSTEYKVYTPENHQAWNEQNFIHFNYSSKANEICDTTIFSSSLLLSANYLLTYHDQKSYLNPQLKPVHVILYRKIADKLDAVVITLQEARELEALVKSNNNPPTAHYWISTTQNTLMAGSPPPQIEHSAEYQSLVEQVKFFNGECKALQQQTTPLLWINDNKEQKMTFFKEKIISCRKTKHEDFEALSAMLEKNNVGFDYIQQHALADLTTMDWKKQYPRAHPTEIAAMHQLALAYQQARVLSKTKEVTLEDFKDHLLSTAAKENLRQGLIPLNASRQKSSKVKKKEPESATFGDTTTPASFTLNEQTVTSSSSYQPKASDATPPQPNEPKDIKQHLISLCQAAKDDGLYQHFNTLVSHNERCSLNNRDFIESKIPLKSVKPLLNSNSTESKVSPKVRSASLQGNATLLAKAYPAATAAVTASNGAPLTQVAVKLVAAQGGVSNITNKEQYKQLDENNKHQVAMELAILYMDKYYRPGQTITIDKGSDEEKLRVYAAVNRLIKVKHALDSHNIGTINIVSDGKTIDDHAKVKANDGLDTWLKTQGDKYNNYFDELSKPKPTIREKLKSWIKKSEIKQPTTIQPKKPGQS